MIRPKLKIALTVIFSLLYILSFENWIVTTIYWKQQWICLECRADDPPSIKQQFIYFTVWNMFFCIVIFTCWAFFMNHSKAQSLMKNVFRVAVPHAVTVTLTYIYYVVSNPTDGFLNTEACHIMYRSFLSKDITTNMSTVTFQLICYNVSDFTLHYFSAPLMLFLLFSKEIEYDVTIPYSTFFITVLGVIIGILDTTTGSRVYCGNVWFNVGMSILINFLVHVLLVLHHHTRGKLCCNKEKDDQADNNEKDIHNAVDEEGFELSN